MLLNFQDKKSEEVRIPTKYLNVISSIFVHQFLLTYNFLKFFKLGFS